jgi:4-amino-4-deoxy-L-arabinose transferase-like glycosyltransferase
MKNKVLAFIKNKPIIVFLILIILLGAFLRTWHFSDWLHFELDQSRDAKIIDLAIKEGASNLPLLGPKAGGTFLRLGPIFYYFNYLSALVFGDTPFGIAAIMALFGIAAIPLFYLFSKRYFSKRDSLLLTLLFSVSGFLVMYSRFSWNPNSLPFWGLLTFYALLRATSEEEKKPGWWFVAFACALAIATQMHFLALVIFSAISALFLLYKRPRIKLKFWAVAVVLVLFLYSPAIANDVMTGGDNIKQILKVAEGKSAKNPRNIADKSLKNYIEHSLGYFLVLSGREEAELPKFTIARAKQEMKCDEGCKANVGWGIAGFLLLTSGLIFLFRSAFLSEKNKAKKDFLILVILWFSSTFIVLTPLAFDIAPRFFLLIAPLPFVLLGLVSLAISERFTKISKWILPILVLFLFVSNAKLLKDRFWQLKNAPYEKFDISIDRILKEKTRVTLEQQYMIVDYLESFYKENGYPVYLNAQPFHRRSLLYDVAVRKIPQDDLRNSKNNKTIYKEGNYFLIHPTFSNYSGEIAEYALDYNVDNIKTFGTMTVIQLSPKPESINAIRQEFDEKEKPKSASGVPVRYRWEEIFNDSNGDEPEE